MQREPDPQSLSPMQLLPDGFAGALSPPSPETEPLQLPSRHRLPGSQSVSNTQACAEVEVRQTRANMARLCLLILRPKSIWDQ